jgi:two-component system sensor histidine kinase KdpD
MRPPSQRHDAAARPDPDALLAVAAREDDRRGRLKIFFGAAPGVGKTFSMLEAARRAVAEGVDVVVGLVETHGRGETAALLDGLEVLPRRRHDHRGQQLAEFDLDAALARRPELLLVDELAHTNAPGSRHTKRWQDVLELLDAGVHVHTTLNVQHLESLNDVVAQITWVRVRETVPDAVFERADEVELVDLPPDALIERLREGRVYLPDQAQQAQAAFFRRGNLLALRELALRRTAQRVDREVLAYRREHGIATTWPASERILVGIGASPRGGRLVRAAARMAAGLRADWVAACVETPGLALAAEAERARVAEHQRLAESLGAEVVSLAGESVADALLEFARARNVTRIIVGKPTRPRWRELLRGSLVDAVVRGSGDIDVHVISGDRDEAPRRPPARPQRAPARGYLAALGGSVATTGLAAVVFEHVDRSDIIMLYILGIMLVAVRSRPRAVDPGGGAERGRVRLLLRAAVPDPRGRRRQVRADVRGDAGGRPRHLGPDREDPAAGRGRPRARGSDRGALLAEPRAGAAAPQEQHRRRAPRGTSARAPAGASSSCCLDAGGELDGGPGHARGGRRDPRELSVARWAFEHGPAGRGTDTLPAAGRCTCR